MKRIICVYSEFPAEYGVIQLTFAEMFNRRNTDIRYIGLRDLFNGRALAPGSILILPGEPHGQGYRDQLGGEGFAKIRTHVERGGALLAICAAAYTACRTSSFTADDGTVMRFAPGFDLLDAHAHGPLRELSDPAKRWGGAVARHDVAMLSFRNDDGEMDEAGVCYSKGPAITINSGEKCDMIARFRDLAGHPPAILGKRIGRGYGVFSSVSIDVSGKRMNELLSGVGHPYADHKIYAEALNALEKSRDRLWALVWQRLTCHRLPPAPA